MNSNVSKESVTEVLTSTLSLNKTPTPPPLPCDLGTCKNLHPVGHRAPTSMSSMFPGHSQVSVKARISTSLSTAKSLTTIVLFLTDLVFIRQNFKVARLDFLELIPPKFEH